MESLINFLHASALAVPILIVLGLWVKRKGIEVDHIFLFSAGFIFYFILPFTLSRSQFFYVHTAYTAWKKVFDAVPSQTWVWYFISVLLFYGAFIAGSWLGSRRSTPTARVKNTIDATALNIFYAIALLFVFLFGYQLRSYFFWSYQKSTQIPVFGSFVAASILLMSVAVCAVVYRYYKSDTTKSLLRSFIHPTTISYGVVAVLLISMGGRVIVVSSIMMVAVFFSVYIRRLRLFTVITLFLSLVLLAHILIIWRESQPFSNLQDYYRQYINLDVILIKLFSENFNVSYSLMDFLGKYSMPLLRFPVVLLSNLIALIPSFVFPGKTAWMLDFSSIGYTIGSPAGGFNAYVSLILNFGILGSSLFLFGFSYFLQRLKQYRSTVFIAIYVMLSGWLAAMFFRDLGQTLIKEMLQFSVFMPLALLVLSRIMTKRRKA